jgi:hypothetical protein
MANAAITSKMTVSISYMFNIISVLLSFHSLVSPVLDQLPASNRST